MAIYHVNLSGPLSGGDGSQGNPFGFVDLLTIIRGGQGLWPKAIYVGDTFYIKGSLDIPTDIGLTSYLSINSAFLLWDTVYDPVNGVDEPWRLNYSASFIRLSENLTIDRMILSAPTINWGTNGVTQEYTNCIIKAAEIGCSPYATIIVKGSTIIISGDLTDNIDNAVTMIDTVAVLNNLVDPGTWVTNNCVFNIASFLGTHTDSQFSWTPPAFPAWDAAKELWDSALLSIGITTPPQPGNPPYTGYSTGLWDSRRTGIGGFYFPAGPEPEPTPAVVTTPIFSTVRTITGNNVYDNLLS